MKSSTRHQRIKLTSSFSSNSSGTFLAAGAALLAMAAVVQYRTRQAERNNPPVGHFIEVDGVRLHYTERGQGQPLVLLHGKGTMMQDFDISGLVDMASTHYRVIVFDRPGYGYSERPRDRIWTPAAQAELLHQALQRLHVQTPIVVAHSWGTQVAVELALAYPDDVRSLVLMSGYYYPSLRLDVPMSSPPAIPVLGDIMRYTISPLIGRLMWPATLRKIFGPAKVTQRFERFPVWMTLRPSQLRASAAETALMIPAAFKLRHRYHELEMPIFILSGKDDQYVNAEANSVRLHKELPQSELRLTRGAGHMLHHLVPHQVMAAIDAADTAAAKQLQTREDTQRRNMRRY